MQVAELFALTHWIDEEVSDTGVVNLYQQLHQVLVHNAAPNHEKQPFESQQESLFEALRVVPLQSLTQDQLTFLECLGIRAHVGDAAILNLEDVLFRNALDIATAASSVAEAMSSIKAGVARADAIQKSLDGCVESTRELEEEVLIRVSFTGGAAISNVVDLKSWSTKWHQIGRGIAMAHGEPPQSFRVVGAGTGSIVIELAVSYRIARTVALILESSLKFAERLMDIRLKAEQLRGMKLSNAKIVKDLEAEAKNEKNLGGESITSSVLLVIDPDGNSDGEQHNALEKSVSTLLDFLDKGGRVDCVLPEPSSEDEGEDGDEKLQEQLSNLRESFARIRLLEASLKQLGPGDDEGDGA